jgi:hypothetical protein
VAVTADILGPADREQIAEPGATVDEVLRQLALFATPPAPAARPAG